ncbi:MAG: LAGLIDADG family homing endonuclease [Dermatophilaceae bacterium]
MDQVKVAARRWRGGLVGTPTVVTVVYDGQARTHDPKWLPTIKEVLRTRLGSTWSVDRHDERGCRIRLSADPAHVLADGEGAAERARVERNVLKLLGPTAVVTGVQMCEGRVCRVSARHEDGPRFAPSGYRARIERTLTEVMPGRWRGLWEMEADRVTFEVRPALPKDLWLPPPVVADADHLLRNYTKARIRLAVDEDGEELAWFPARVPHLLVTGATGSGKTSLGSGVVGQFAAHGWPVWISDAKRVEFIDWRGYPNVQIVATTVAEQVAMIHRALELVEYRYALVDAGLAKISDFTPLVVVLDEFAELREDLLEWYPRVKPPGRGVDSKPPTLRQVGRLGRKARTARVHLCVLLQRPDVAFLGGEALAIDTPIATPTGWTTMGAIEVGQYVFGEDGRPVRVSATTEVTEGRPCYRVTFSDGSIIVTDENHLWLARSALQRAGDLTPAQFLPREIRWPTQAALADQLSMVAVDNGEVTVTEFEREFGGSRLTLLRAGINDGRWGLRPAGHRPGEAGRLRARTYRRADLIGAPRTERASPAPTWRQVAPQIVTTAEMAKTLKYRDARSNWSVQVGEPLELSEADLPVDPWLLGYWLGDGHKANATIATTDDEVLERIRALGYRVQHYARFNYGITTGGRGGRQRATLVGALRALNLLHNKHIPNGYLRASARQRAELLAGLLDADGTCAVRCRGDVVSGQVSFINSDRRLIDGVAELMASLGFIPTVRQARAEGFETGPSSVAYGRRLREG